MMFTLLLYCVLASAIVPTYSQRRALVDYPSRSTDHNRSFTGPSPRSNIAIGPTTEAPSNRPQIRAVSGKDEARDDSLKGSGRLPKDDEGRERGGGVRSESRYSPKGEGGSGVRSGSRRQEDTAFARDKVHTNSQHRTESTYDRGREFSVDSHGYRGSSRDRRLNESLRDPYEEDHKHPGERKLGEDDSSGDHRHKSSSGDERDRDSRDDYRRPRREGDKDDRDSLSDGRLRKGDRDLHDDKHRVTTDDDADDRRAHRDSRDSHHSEDNPRYTDKEVDKFHEHLYDGRHGAAVDDHAYKSHSESARGGRDSYNTREKAAVDDYRHAESTDGGKLHKGHKDHHDDRHSATADDHTHKSHLEATRSHRGGDRDSHYSREKVDDYRHAESADGRKLNKGHKDHHDDRHSATADDHTYKSHLDATRSHRGGDRDSHYSREKVDDYRHAQSTDGRKLNKGHKDHHDDGHSATADDHTYKSHLDATRSHNSREKVVMDDYGHEESSDGRRFHKDDKDPYHDRHSAIADDHVYKSHLDATKLHRGGGGDSHKDVEHGHGHKDGSGNLDVSVKVSHHDDSKVPADDYAHTGRADDRKLSTGHRDSHDDRHRITKDHHTDTDGFHGRDFYHGGKRVSEGDYGHTIRDEDKKFDDDDDKGGSYGVDQGPESRLDERMLDGSSVRQKETFSGGDKLPNRDRMDGHEHSSPYVDRDAGDRRLERRHSDKKSDDDEEYRSQTDDRSRHKTGDERGNRERIEIRPNERNENRRDSVTYDGGATRHYDKGEDGTDRKVIEESRETSSSGHGKSKEIVTRPIPPQSGRREISQPSSPGVVSGGSSRRHGSDYDTDLPKGSVRDRPDDRPRSRSDSDDDYRLNQRGSVAKDYRHYDAKDDPDHSSPDRYGGSTVTSTGNPHHRNESNLERKDPIASDTRRSRPSESSNRGSRRPLHSSSDESPADLHPPVSRHHSADYDSEKGEGRYSSVQDHTLSVRNETMSKGDYGSDRPRSSDGRDYRVSSSETRHYHRGEESTGSQTKAVSVSAGSSRGGSEGSAISSGRSDGVSRSSNHRDGKYEIPSSSRSPARNHESAEKYSPASNIGTHARDEKLPPHSSGPRQPVNNPRLLDDTSSHHGKRHQPAEGRVRTSPDISPKVQRNDPISNQSPTRNPGTYSNYPRTPSSTIAPDDAYRKPLSSKEVIEAAYRDVDVNRQKEVHYPVFDPNVHNMTSPEIIRPNERRGVIITARRKRK